MINLKDKRIILTGGAGFLGQSVQERLAEQGVPKEKVFIPRRKNYDLRKREGIKKMFSDFPKPDIVIHLAANVGGIGYNKEHPAELFYDNLIMGTQLIDQASLEGIEKLVVIGTICAYPRFTPVPFKEEDLWKGYPEETNAPYGLAKLMLLVQAQSYRKQHGLNAIYLLPVNLYGPRDNFNPESSHVIPALIKKVHDAKKSEKQSITCWGTGKASREFLYVEDAARGIVQATQLYDEGEPVNLGAGREITIKDLTNMIACSMDYRGQIEWDTSKPDGQPRRCLDVSRAKEKFGFTATTRLEEGLRKTIDWFVESNKK